MKTTHLSSNPILRTTLVWGGIVGTAVIIVAAVVGGLVAGSAGAWSGVLGALVGILFPAFTAISILIANRWYGSPSYLQIFFGMLMPGMTPVRFMKRMPKNIVVRMGRNRFPSRSPRIW